jgi:hypothetical protein
MDTWVWIVIAAVVVVAVVLVVAASLVGRQRRSHLKERFGPEYDRTVDSADRRRQAERELREREDRHDQLELARSHPRRVRVMSSVGRHYSRSSWTARRWRSPMPTA